MSGNIKVSGTWKTTGNVYVKVGGTWRTAFQAYTKVGGTWKLWYSKVSDTFTRANTSSGLGTAEIGPSWNSLFGNWYVNSGAATSGDAVSAGVAGAISYLNLNNANATVAVGGQTTTAGVGPAVWVSAAGSWWAAIGYNGQTNTTYTYNCNCTCNGHTVPTCKSCTSPDFGTFTGTTYYSPTQHDEWKNYATTTTYSNSGSTPSGSTTYAFHGASSSSTATKSGDDPVTWYCTQADVDAPYYVSHCTTVGACDTTAHGTVCSRSPITYSCSSGTLSGGNCYSCPTAGDVWGGSLNGNYGSCYTPNTTYTCATGTYYASPPSGCTSGCCTSSTSTSWNGTCSQGFSFGSSCYICASGPQNFTYQYNPNTASYGYFCSYTYSYYGSGTSCTSCGTLYTFYSGGTANPSTGAGCDSYGFTCQTCTGGSIVNNYYMQVINSTTTGAAYTVYSTSADYGTQIGNISITTSGNTLTATAYSTTGSTLGTLTATNSGTKGGGAGLVKAYTPYNQAVTGDNFSATLGATS